MTGVGGRELGDPQSFWDPGCAVRPAAGDSRFADSLARRLPVQDFGRFPSPSTPNRDNDLPILSTLSGGLR